MTEINDLNFENRKERSLLIATIATAVIFAINLTIPFYVQQYNLIYTDNLCIFGSCPFGEFSFLSASALASLFLILLHIAVYIYYELKGLSNSTGSKRDIYIANKIYKYLFQAFSYHIAINLLLLIFLSTFFSTTILWIGIILLILFILLISMLICFVTKNSRVAKSNLFLYFLAHLLICFLLFVIGIEMLLSNYGNIRLDFSDKADLPLQITISGYCDKPSIKYIVYDSKNSHTYSVKSEDISTSYIEIMKKNTFNDNNSKKTVGTNKSSDKYTFSTSFNVKDKISDGVNTICIIINIDSKEIKIVNEIRVVSGKVIIMQKTLSSSF